MNKFISWATENAINLGVLIWFISSLFDLSGILFSVKHTDTETKVSIETPISVKETPIKEQKQKDSSIQATEDGPKASW